MLRTTLWCCLLWCWFAVPVRAELPAPVVQALQRGEVPQDAVAVYVRRLDSDQAAVAHLAERAMHPASTMKLLTTYAGLELLGPAYRWRTEVYRQGELNHGVLQGDLLLKGYGDPELTQQEFWLMLSDLRQAGVQYIRGDLLLDNSYFAPEQRDAGAFDNEPYRAYNAVPDALVSNFSAAEFRFSVIGKHVEVRVNPALPQIVIKNEMQPGNGACGSWRSGLRYEVRHAAAAATVTFSGRYPSSCGAQSLNLVLFEPAVYTYHLFRQIWQQLGGTLDGSYRLAPLVPDAVKLLTHESAPLAEVIRRINKFSNNLMTRQLLLTIAAERVGMPGTERAGVTVLQQWLADKGLLFPELVVENGAGLSRTARISARHLGEVLADAYRSPLMPELVSSLPLLAVDGTLRRRLPGSVLQGQGHLKTGSLDDVRTLAGYLQDSQRRYWLVVFMVGHARAAASREAQDALLDWVYHQP